MPVSSKKCIGRSLYNHLKQKNIKIDVTYTLDSVTKRWDGTLAVYGTTFLVKGKQSKNLVLEQLMEDANSFIWSNLTVKKE